MLFFMGPMLSVECCLDNMGMGGVLGRSSSHQKVALDLFIEFWIALKKNGPRRLAAYILKGDICTIFEEQLQDTTILAIGGLMECC